MQSFHNNPDPNLNARDCEIYLEISKDVHRTFPHLHFFQIGDIENKILNPHTEALQRILFIWAKLNPGIGYVQGMNEVVGPIYYLFATDKDTSFQDHAEADAFHCFTSLMSEIGDNFCKTLDKSSLGIISKMNELNDLLKKKDFELWHNMELKNLYPQYYSFRWLTLLLSQEFELPDVLRLWDSLFSDTHRFEFLVYFCCSMIINLRETLLSTDFSDNLKLLQDYPPGADFFRILELAKMIQDPECVISRNPEEDRFNLDHISKMVLDFVDNL